MYKDDEKYYDLVANELRTGNVREGLWAKALSSANGDEKVAKSIYIKLRVAQMIKNEKEELKNQHPVWTVFGKFFYGSLGILGLVLTFLLCVNLFKEIESFGVYRGEEVAGEGVGVVLLIAFSVWCFKKTIEACKD